MTMVAHGVPVVPPAPTPAISSTNCEYIESTATNIVIADTVLKSAKYASETFKNVTYVKAFAEILIQIINIGKEIQTEKDQSQELINKILRRSKVILDGLLRVGPSPNKDQLKNIEGKLKDYNSLLVKILRALNGRAAKNVFDRLINRSSRLGDLKKYDRLFDDFNTDFVATYSYDDVVHTSSTYSQLYPPSRFELSITNSAMNAGGNININIGGNNPAYSQVPPSQPSAASDTIYYKPILPPPPELMIGRDGEKSEILDMLLSKTLARIAILGAGGMGKTTIALSSLHDPAVIERFPSRYFVSCEAVTSTTTLVGEIANVLRIPPAKRDKHLIDTILSSFRDNAALCLDNFETIWENEAARSDVEEFLSHLNHLPQLAIIVTMRGTQRPSRVSWSKPLLPPLERLSDANSKLIFEAICGPVDEFVEKLLKAIDGIPLAVTLVSALLQEGNETSESLWARWEKTHTSVVENGSNDKLSNLDTSIHLSVYGPRMQADPNTISILAMLSILPDGLAYGGEADIDELQHHLPEDNGLREALLTMRRVALLHVDKANTPHRLRMLAPIRHFCERRLETPEILQSGLVSFYIQMISSFTDVRDPAGHAVIPTELGNMHAVFIEACKRRKGNDTVIHACIGYTKWSLYVGIPVEEVICLAMEGISGSPGLLGDCHRALSNVYFRRSKIDEAQASLEHAVEFHRQANDVLGEANDVRKLGEVHLRRNKLDVAESFFEHAAQLHRQAHDDVGEATDVCKLGDVYFRQNKLDEAQASFEHAAQLHRQAHDVLREGYDAYKLGEVHLRRDKLDEAQASLEHAVQLHRQGQSVLGEAYDLRMLGVVYLRRNKLDEAQASFEQAVQLHKQAQSVLGEADDLRKLGEVYLRRDKLDEAQASFEHAIQLHRQVQSVLGEAYDVRKLGDVHLRRDKLDEAQASFEHAVQLHRQVHSVLGEANGVYKLGKMHLRRNKLDEAQVSFEHAVQLHRQARDVLGEAYDVCMLGEVYLRRDKLDEAQASFENAVQLHRQVHSVLGEANGVYDLGEVHLRRNELDEAQASFELAVQLHRQAQDVLGEANDVQKLGEVHLRRDKLDDAQASFENAVQLHRQAQFILGEANGVQKLGEVHLRRGKLDDAQASFEHAVELHRQVHDVLGEECDVRKLEDVHLQREKLGKTLTCLAVELGE